MLRPPDEFGHVWQYHPQSDAHSKIACWGIMVDLLDHCSLLAQHVRDSKVGFGINHRMRDFRLNRKKNLDLVVCRPGGPFGERSLDDLADKYGISLAEAEEAVLRRIPEIRECSVGTTLIALEAKACMTEHLKALPRLYDELSSSFQTVLGDTNNAIAAAFVTINLSPTFISPGRNKVPGAELEITHTEQPRVSQRTLDKVKELPRRSNPEEVGFDAIGVVLVSCANDGSEPLLCADFGDGTGVDEAFTYPQMIRRISHIYSTRFRSI